MVFILASAGLVGGRAHLAGIGRSFDRLAASKAASSRLEELSAPGADLVEGERAFDPGVPGHRGRVRIASRAPGLFEIRATVASEDGTRRVELVTLVAREEPR
jgi:hypothetical protein